MQRARTRLAARAPAERVAHSRAVRRSRNEIAQRRVWELRRILAYGTYNLEAGLDVVVEGLWHAAECSRTSAKKGA